MLSLICSKEIGMKCNDTKALRQALQTVKQDGSSKAMRDPEVIATMLRITKTYPVEVIDEVLDRLKGKAK